MSHLTVSEMPRTHVSAVSDEPTVLSKDSDAQWVRGLGIDVTAAPPAKCMMVWEGL